MQRKWRSSLPVSNGVGVSMLPATVTEFSRALNVAEHVRRWAVPSSVFTGVCVWPAGPSVERLVRPI